MTGVALASAPLAPGWLVLPLGVVTLLVLAAHVMALREAPMPESRRRIRVANGLVMMILTPLLAYAFGIATPGEPRAFVLAWSASIGLLLLMILLAGADAMNTLRLHLSDRASSSRSLSRTLRDVASAPRNPGVRPAPVDAEGRPDA